MSVTHLQKWDVTAIEIALDLEMPHFVRPNPVCFFRAGGTADLPRGRVCAHVAAETNRRGRQSSPAGTAAFTIASSSGNSTVGGSLSCSPVSSADACSFATSIEVDSCHRTRIGTRGRFSSREASHGRWPRTFCRRLYIPQDASQLRTCEPVRRFRGSGTHGNRHHDLSTRSARCSNVNPRPLGLYG